MVNPEATACNTNMLTKHHLYRTSGLHVYIVLCVISVHIYRQIKSSRCELQYLVSPKESP